MPPAQEAMDQMTRGLQKALEMAMQVDGATERAHVDELRRNHPGETPRQLAQRLIDNTRKLATGTGFATGLPSNPWIALPAAAVDVGVVLRLEILLAARIALIYDPTYLDDGKPPWELLGPVLGAETIAHFVRDVALGGRSAVDSRNVRNLMTAEMISQLKHVAARFLSKRMARRGLGKMVPLLGGVVSGVWNYREVAQVGERVLALFEGRTAQA